MEEQAADATIQLPEQASTLAPMVDSLYYDIYWISVAFFVAVVGCMVLFAWRYRRRKGVKSKPPGHHNALELFWTFSPLILLAYMFHQGFEGFMFMSVPPATSIPVRVEAFQWGWRFQQPNGLVESELWVPQGRPVRLIMGSIPRGTEAGQGAVLHSFYVPALRVKRDVVPGMFTSLWFEATRLGTYDIFCTEYCGVGEPAEGAVLSDEDLRQNGRPTAAAGHSGMLSRIHIVTPEEYERHLIEGMRNPYGDDFPRWGEELFTQNGCPACHVVTPGAPPSVGPNLAGIAGTPQALESGESHTADLEYLRESIREPQAQIVHGFTGASMPSFAALGELKIDALAAYIGSLSPQGQEVVQAVQQAHPEGQ